MTHSPPGERIPPPPNITSNAMTSRTAPNQEANLTVLKGTVDISIATIMFISMHIGPEKGQKTRKKMLLGNRQAIDEWNWWMQTAVWEEFWNRLYQGQWWIILRKSPNTSKYQPIIQLLVQPLLSLQIPNHLVLRLCFTMVQCNYCRARTIKIRVHSLKLTARP